jgi:5'-3' exonuclease
MAPAHLLLIDSSGFAYRAYHGGSKFPRYRQSDGAPTGTVIAFLEMIHRLMNDAAKDPVSHVAAVFDNREAPTFRHKIYPAYKGNRTQRDPELSVQLPVMRDAARALGITPVEAVGYEADDVMATLARWGVEAGLRVTIVSSDKDMGQLVEDDRIEIVDDRKGIRVLAADVEAKFGVPPHLVADVQALSGDMVDNIPGVPGVGSGMAGKLIRKLGDLDAVLREAAKSTGYRMTAGAKLSINNHRKEIKIYRKLTGLADDVALGVTLDGLAAVPMNPVHLKELLLALEAPDALRRIMSGGKIGGTYEAVARIDVEDRLEWHTKALAEYQAKLARPSHKITLPAPAEPQCGWYKRKLVQDGPWVPARIWREGFGDKDALLCSVGDTPRNPADQWGRLLSYPISEVDYETMMARRAAVANMPLEPEANPGEPINYRTIPV